MIQISGKVNTFINSKLKSKLSKKIAGKDIPTEIIIINEKTDEHGTITYSVEKESIQKLFGDIIENTSISNKYQAMRDRSVEKNSGWEKILDDWHEEGLI